MNKKEYVKLQTFDQATRNVFKKQRTMRPEELFLQQMAENTNKIDQDIKDVLNCSQRVKDNTERMIQKTQDSLDGAHNS